jgi:hypothetical protein
LQRLRARLDLIDEGLLDDMHAHRLCEVDHVVSVQSVLEKRAAAIPKAAVNALEKKLAAICTRGQQGRTAACPVDQNVSRTISLMGTDFALVYCCMAWHGGYLRCALKYRGAVASSLPMRLNLTDNLSIMQVALCFLHATVDN